MNQPVKESLGGFLEEFSRSKFERFFGKPPEEFWKVLQNKNLKLSQEKYLNKYIKALLK